jgi:hypothetical protein
VRQSPDMSSGFAFPSKSILAGRPSVASFASTTLDNDEKGSPIRQSDDRRALETERLVRVAEVLGAPIARHVFGRATKQLRAKKVGSMVAMGTVLAAYAATWVYLSLRIDATSIRPFSPAT